jgi:hypothetical protein
VTLVTVGNSGDPKVSVVGVRGLQLLLNWRGSEEGYGCSTIVVARGMEQSTETMKVVIYRRGMVHSTELWVKI